MCRDMSCLGVVTVLVFSGLSSLLFFFFFQAEDGIRDLTVTGVQTCALPISVRSRLSVTACCTGWATVTFGGGGGGGFAGSDRKSTRLNSSHSQISYAVFCLKKKKKTRAVDACTSAMTHHASRMHEYTRPNTD